MLPQMYGRCRLLFDCRMISLRGCETDDLGGLDEGVLRGRDKPTVSLEPIDLESPWRPLMDE